MAQWVRIGFILMSFANGPAVAATYIVKPDGSGDFPTIQAAVDGATSGDVIQLSPGRYRGEGNRDIDLQGKNLTIRSQSGDPYACVISPEGNSERPHRAFVLQSGEGRATILEGFTVSGGFSERGGAVYCSGSSPSIRKCVFLGNESQGGWNGVGGGGISCDGEASPRIENCVFRENRSNWGGGVHSFESVPILIECAFERNTAIMGGGAWFDSGSTVTVVDCDFRENEASNTAAALMCVSGTTADISGTSFVDNHCEVKGGAVSVVSCDGVQFLSCLFQRNSAGTGGGFHAEFSGAPTLVNCTFVGNSAEERGGAAAVRIEALARFTNCTFFENSAAEGAVISVETQGEATVENSVLSFSTSGGSVHCDGLSGIVLLCSDVVGNEGGDWIGCIEDQLGTAGNFSADPMFCDPAGGDFRIAADSPCAPDQAPGECGLIGAHDVGCGMMGLPEREAGSRGKLCRALPNPSRNGVWLSFRTGDGTLPTALRIVDASGRVARVMSGMPQGQGQVQAYWDGRSSDGRPVSAGVYYLEYGVGEDVERRQIVLVR